MFIMRCAGKLERLLFVLGLLLLSIFVGAHLHRAILSRAALDTFKAATRIPTGHAPAVELVAAKPDFSLWAGKRIRDYEHSLLTPFAPAIGILRIPKIHLEVPVLEGNDDWSLNRGVGRVPGTASPGENGNIGIAGHRDGFFRGLKDVETGDTIELVTARGTETYLIDRIVIVEPDDVSVLGPRPHPSLTLVTCYPFYFVGNAPQRYIVQASISDSDRTNDRVERSDADSKITDKQQSTQGVVSEPATQSMVQIPDKEKTR